MSDQQPGRETTANDRSAGRWCEICQQHGSHHTDRHDLFVTAGRQPTRSQSSDGSAAAEKIENEAGRKPSTSTSGGEHVPDDLA